MFVQPGFEGGRGFPGGIFPSRGEVVTRAVPNEREIFSTLLGHFKIRKNLHFSSILNPSIFR